MSGQWLGFAITEQVLKEVVFLVEAELDCLMPLGGDGKIFPTAHHYPI